MTRAQSLNGGSLLTILTAVGLVAALVGSWFENYVPTEVTILGLWMVYLAGGGPAARRAVTTLWRESILDIDLLMVVAALAAAAVGAFLEGAVLLTLFSISTTLEERALGRARRAVEALMALRPATALRKNPSGGETEIPAADLQMGDIVVLRPGARVPADGRVVRGRSTIDESSITGESMPVAKEQGADVYEATVNIDGVLDVKVTKTVEESTVARMIALVTQAQATKAPSERFSSWFGQRYTIGVMIGAALTFVIFRFLGSDWEDALYRSATLLVAASPCAIVISVPAAILSALSAAARGGVLFKGGAALETLSAVDTFAFDKTGTLTEGKAAVARVVALDGNEEGFLSLLAGLEAHSEHHSAAAVRSSAAARGIAFLPVENVVTLPSAGIVGEHGGARLWAGNPRMAAAMNAPITHHALIELAEDNQTVIYVGRGDETIGAVTVADRARSTSFAAIASLREYGVRKTVLMTGDRLPVALRIGKELGFHEADIRADMLPEDKVALVAELSSKGKVAFVGDGINDAAALARADVGIAMGAAGSDVALQAADVALMSDDMGQLPEALRLARRTARIIRQNLTFAMGAMCVLVAGGLFFDLPLPLAVIGHEGGTVLVVLNGLRLLRDPIRRHAKVPDRTEERQKGLEVVPYQRRVWRQPHG